MTPSDYVAANRANWDERVERHLIAYGADDSPPAYLLADSAPPGVGTAPRDTSRNR